MMQYIPWYIDECFTIDETIHEILMIEVETNPK